MCMDQLQKALYCYNRGVLRKDILFIWLQRNSPSHVLMRMAKNNSWQHKPVLLPPITWLEIFAITVLLLFYVLCQFIAYHFTHTWHTTIRMFFIYFECLLFWFIMTERIYHMLQHVFCKLKVTSGIMILCFYVATALGNRVTC